MNISGKRGTLRLAIDKHNILDYNYQFKKSYSNLYLIINSYSLTLLCAKANSFFVLGEVKDKSGKKQANQQTHPSIHADMKAER